MPNLAHSVIFTLGHSRHPAPAFVGLLKQHRVDMVVDVRGEPYSRHNPQFNRSTLARTLRDAGIDYIWCGAHLSGRPKDKSFYGPGGDVLWDELRQWPALQRELGALCVRARTRRVTLVCAEEDPRRCHRRFLLTPALQARGVEVRHIRGDGRIETEAEIEIDAGSDQMSLFS